MFVSCFKPKKYFRKARDQEPNLENQNNAENQDDEDQQQPEDEGRDESPESVLVDLHDMNREPLNSPSTKKNQQPSEHGRSANPGRNFQIMMMKRNNP